MKLPIACLFASAAAVAATEQRAEMRMMANPIRKVVNMLQMMQKKVQEEGEKAEDLFKKYMCYCTTNRGVLAESIEAAEAKVPELTANIEASEGKLAQLNKDIPQHQADRAAAKEAMAQAEALRAKEKAAFESAFNENKVNVDAIAKAVAALERGAAGGFLQTGAAATLTALVKGSQSMEDADRQDVLAFLSGTYAPASGEIIGILKQLHDEMLKDQQDMVAAEEAAAKEHASLMEAKTKEVEALSKTLEEKLARTAELSVQIAEMKNDVEDTAEGLEQDKAFLADLAKNCDSKAAVHEEEKKVRAEELVALADTIKILNDDEALDLFKKTLPGPSESFMQVQVTASSMRAQARELLEQARSRAPGVGHQRLDFIALALRGRKVGFEKVITLIDELVEMLKKEQVDDDAKKEYCAKEFDSSEDKQKELQRSIADLETVIAEAKEGIATMTDEIKALEEGIKALDTSVAEATEQRKAENAEYKDLMSSNTAAKELILFAKNRLQKFYNPKLYKAPPKAELSSEDRMYENMGGEITTLAPAGIAGTGITAFVQLRSKSEHGVAPPPPPETAAAYMKKSEESGGVMQMMGLLVADVDKEMTVAEAEEKAAQSQYEKLMEEAAAKRAEDSKAITNKQAAVADLTSSVETSAGEKKAAEKELMATEQYIMNLHAECDWLVQYYEVRKEARADEVDSLGKAKAVLSGADFSLLQRGERHTARARKFHLRGA